MPAISFVAVIVLKIVQSCGCPFWPLKNGKTTKKLFSWFFLFSNAPHYLLRYLYDFLLSDLGLQSQMGQLASQIENWIEPNGSKSNKNKLVRPYYITQYSITIQ